MFAGLGRASLWEPDEPRYAEATRQMLDRGDLLTPWFNGEPRFEKPILVYWLQLPFVAAMGPREVALRLPIALLGAGCVVLTYLIGARLFGPRVAWLAALALATSFRPMTFARLGLTDTPAVFFELLALYGFLRGHQDASARRAWIVAWVGVGLATLTKGPVAAVPLVVWLAYLAVVRDWTGVQRMRIGAGVLLAMAIAGPWYGYMTMTHGRPFVDVALMSEVVARVEGAVGGPPRGPFYYLGVWPADMLPWTPFFLAAVALLVSRSRLDAAERRTAVLPVVWFVTVIALFSLSSSKTAHYILPAYPAAALLTAVAIARAERDPIARRLWWAATALAVGLLVVAAVLAAALLRRTTDPAVTSAWLVLPLLLVAGAAGVVILGRRVGPAAGSATLAVTIALVVGYAALAAVPRLQGLQPVPQLGTLALAASTPGARIGQYGDEVSAGFVFYTRQRVQLLRTHDDVVAFLSEPGPALCLLPGPDAAALAAHVPGRVYEIARVRRLVVRLDRLFDGRSLFDEAVVLVSNHPRSD